MTHELTHAIDSGLSLERLEQILHSYTDPTPELRYRRVRHGTGIAGLVEVLRDPAKLPYVPSRDVAHIKKGQIFVRHGTSVEEPTERERENLLREGEEARRRA